MADLVMIEIARAILRSPVGQPDSEEEVHAARIRRTLERGRHTRRRLKEAFDTASKNPSDSNIEKFAYHLYHASLLSPWYREAIDQMRFLVAPASEEGEGEIDPLHSMGRPGRRTGSLEKTSREAPPRQATHSAPTKPSMFRGELPVAIYLSDEEASTDVERAVEKVLGELGFEVSKRQPPVLGSWFRRMAARTKKLSTNVEVADRLEKVERAVEMQVLHRQQAEIDSAQGEAVANLLQALEGTEQALIQIGSLLIIKVDGTHIVRNLSQSELAHLEKNPRLQSSPKDILEELQRATRAMEGARGKRELSEGVGGTPDPSSES